MRLIHLCFQLHLPYESLKDDLEQKFREADERIYQPFFALMERNAQKYANGWRFSLVISGTWLELAEKYDRALIERLKKILKTGRVELINEPFYHSLAFFYNKEELAEQVKLYQDKVRDLFGFEGRMFAMPDFMYNNAIGKWAEENGFAGMLVGGGEQVLDFRSANHVYEAAGCEYLRLLFQNRELTQKVVTADESLLTETERDGKKKTVLSANKFQKMLDLECLRGNLVNLYFDAEILAKQREKGVIGFFDLLIENWLAVKGNKFVNAKEACVVETPTMELDVRETVDWKGVAPEKKAESETLALVSLKDFEYSLPERFKSGVREKFGQKLYTVGKVVMSTEDAGLLQEFRKYTVADLQARVKAGALDDWERVLDDLKARADEVRKQQAVEVSQAYTKKRDRGLEEDSEVKVNFGKKPETAAVDEVEVKIGKVEIPEEQEQAEEEITEEIVEPAVEEKVQEIEVVPTEIVVDEPEIVLPNNDTKKSTRKVRKIIKKLVIE